MTPPFPRGWPRPRPLRRPRRPSFAVLLLAAAALAALYFLRVPASRRPAPDAVANPSATDIRLVEDATGAFCPDSGRLPVARVLGVLDGDTLRVAWEGRPEFLRYFGSNTPEREQPCYAGATERNRRLAGEAVRLVFDARTRDPHGRLLAYPFTLDGRSIDAQLIAEGWARAWPRDGAFKAVLERLESAARASRVGCLWSGAGR